MHSSLILLNSSLLKALPLNIPMILQASGVIVDYVSQVLWILNTKSDVRLLVRIMSFQSPCEPLAPQERQTKYKALKLKYHLCLEVCYWLSN